MFLTSPVSSEDFFSGSIYFVFKKKFKNFSFKFIRQEKKLIIKTYKLKKNLIFELILVFLMLNL